MGYTKVTLTPGLNLVGSQFVSTLGLDKAVGELVIASGQGTYDSEWQPTTEIRVWVGNGYVTYGWTGSFLQNGPADLVSELGVDDTSLDNTWLDETYAVAEDTLPLGGGFWVKAGAQGSVLLYGQVDDETTKTIEINPGLNLVSSPWPAELTFDKIAVTGQGTYDSEWQPTTEIRVWVGNGYVTYGWTGSFLQDGPADLVSELGIDDTSLDNKWLDETYAVAEDTIAVGKGFWIKAGARGSVVFTK